MSRLHRPAPYLPDETETEGEPKRGGLRLCQPRQLTRRCRRRSQTCAREAAGIRRGLRVTYSLSRRSHYMDGILYNTLNDIMILPRLALSLSLSLSAAAGAMACTHRAPGSSNDPPPKGWPADGGVALGTRVVTVCAPGPPGSFTDPPPGGRHPGERMPFFLVQDNQSNSPRVSGGAGRAALESGCGSQDHRDGGGRSLAQEVGRDRRPGVRQGAGGGPSVRALSPICSCPFPGREGDRHLPCREGGGQLEPD